MWNVNPITNFILIFPSIMTLKLSTDDIKMNVSHLNMGIMGHRRQAVIAGSLRLIFLLKYSVMYWDSLLKMMPSNWMFTEATNFAENGKSFFAHPLVPAAHLWLWVYSLGLVSHYGSYLVWVGPIRSSDNDSTGFWPPGSLHTLGADGHI